MNPELRKLCSSHMCMRISCGPNMCDQSTVCSSEPTHSCSMKFQFQLVMLWTFYCLCLGPLAPLDHYSWCWSWTSLCPAHFSVFPASISTREGLLISWLVKTGVQYRKQENTKYAGEKGSLSIFPRQHKVLLTDHLHLLIKHFLMECYCVSCTEYVNL